MVRVNSVLLMIHFWGFFNFSLVFQGQKFVFTDNTFSLSLLFVVWDIKYLREADLCLCIPNNHIFFLYSGWFNYCIYTFPVVNLKQTECLKLLIRTEFILPKGCQLK